MLDSIPADQEREIAAETAHHAMVAGWEKAIQIVGRKHGLKQFAMENILTRVSRDQGKRDPSGRIDELRDWDLHKQRDRSDLKKPTPGDNLHKLSPGLRRYMEKKLAKSKMS